MLNSPIETIKPLYKAGKVKMPTIYRFSQQGARYYFTVTRNLVKFYRSVTSVIAQATPTSYGIKKLIGELGLDGFYAMFNRKGHYGTLLHEFSADYLRFREFDFDTITERTAKYIAEHKIKDVQVSDWDWSLKQDLAAIIQFCIDYDVEPLIIEGTGIYDDGITSFAGTCDIICYLNIEEKGYFGEVYKSGPRKGEPKETKTTKRVLAIVDFKSGKSGFFEDHEIQLKMYAMIAEHSFGLRPEKLLNVAPAEWRTEPSYKVKDQTDSPSHAKVPYILMQSAVDWEEPKDIMIIAGKANGSLSDVVRKVSAQDYVLSMMKKPARKSAKRPAAKNGRAKAVATQVGLFNLS